MVLVGISKGSNIGVGRVAAGGGGVGGSGW
jgi:hypothetical protein